MICHLVPDFKNPFPEVVMIGRPIMTGIALKWPRSAVMGNQEDRDDGVED